MANKKVCNKADILTKSLSHRYLPESTQRELSNGQCLEDFQKYFRPCALDESTLALEALRG